MDFNKFIKKMKEAKIKIENEKDFLPEEKKILFENIAKKFLSEDEKSQMQKTKTSQLMKKTELNENKSFDSFSSIIAKGKITQHIDYVLFAGHYLVIQKDYENFNVKDISDEYKKNYIKQTNINVFLKNLVKKGFFMPYGKKDGLSAFSITRDGINYVETVIDNGKQ